MAVAGPTDIPPELVFHVVECLLPVKFDAWLPRCDRLTLARCSLVCTYWSTLFRSVLFKRLELWEERDVYTLEAFIDSPTSKIKNLIHRLVLHPTPHSTRWIPLIPALIQDLPNCHRVEMMLEKHFLGHTAAPFFRAEFASPPLQSLFSQIRTLSLSDYHLVSFSELAQCIANMPLLQSFFCDNLTWPDGPLPLHQSETMHVSPALRHIECRYQPRSDFSSLSWLFLSDPPRHSYPEDSLFPLIESHELSNICTFMQTWAATSLSFLEPWSNDPPPPRPLYNPVMTLERGRKSEEQLPERWCLALKYDLQGVQPPRLRAKFFLGAATIAGPLSVQRIHTELPVLLATSDTSLGSQMKKADELSLQFKQLTEYRVLLRESARSSEKEVSQAVQVVRAQMALTERAGKLLSIVHPLARILCIVGRF